MIKHCGFGSLLWIVVNDNDPVDPGTVQVTSQIRRYTWYHPHGGHDYVYGIHADFGAVHVPV
jgi:hypothetical protein